MTNSQRLTGSSIDSLAGDRSSFRLLLPDVEEEFAEGLDGEGWECFSGEPLVGGLLGSVEGLGFEAEGDGTDDGDAEGMFYGSSSSKVKDFGLSLVLRRLY